MRTPLYYERIHGQLFWPTVALIIAAPFNEGPIYAQLMLLISFNSLISIICAMRASTLHMERAERRYVETERRLILKALRS